MKKLNCILLIDDNIHDNYFHSRIINEVDAANQIKTATDGENALDYFERSKKDPDQYPFPDLIFLDINMPKINGFEFLERVKEKKIINEGMPVVIIMLTSSLNPNDEQIVHDKYSNLVRNFKNKPLTTDTLKEIIDEYF